MKNRNFSLKYYEEKARGGTGIDVKGANRGKGEDRKSAKNPRGSDRSPEEKRGRTHLARIPKKKR